MTSVGVDKVLVEGGTDPSILTDGAGPKNEETMASIVSSQTLEKGVMVC
jgi:hypothetical protein